MIDGGGLLSTGEKRHPSPQPGSRLEPISLTAPERTHRGCARPKKENMPKDLIKQFSIDADEVEAAVEAVLASTTTEVLEKQYDDSVQTFMIDTIIPGRIIKVLGNEVIVDIGYKSEGVIPADEFEAENIYRHIEEGAPLKEAAIRGAEEVMWPVTAAIATMAAFIPMLLITGPAGEFMAILPKTACWALSAPPGRRRWRPGCA